MDTQHGKAPEKTEMIKRALGKPLPAGEMGVLMARAGVGKTACLTHIALERLLAGSTVLHVCIDETPEKAKVWYLELMKNIFSQEQGESVINAQSKIEPLRFIQSYLQQTFTPQKLDENLKTLEASADFRPEMIVLDGLDFDHEDRTTLEALKTIGRENGISIWMSARTHRHKTDVSNHGIPYPCHQLEDLFHSILLLKPVAKSIQVEVLKHDGNYTPALPPLTLNAQSYLMDGS